MKNALYLFCLVLHLSVSVLPAAEIRKPQESLGSLVAKIDGRETPLALGYHKVSVEIRDQIARTTIEESFINRTHQRTEGVFYFPLPGDASIAGFGMWIGNELVEADIVEKQRAREIFETILREKRDPGLLEWTEGNIFKARVFPIEPLGEKRIKIVYTQFLPKKNGKYVYHYPLQSEMLRQNPLREFALDVIVDDAALGNVVCTTHKTAIEQRRGEATVKYAAKNYTPETDFRLEIATVKDVPVIQFIPHVRDVQDGYFLLKINTQEAIHKVTERPPHNLLILVDTSASMNENSRRLQTEFIRALLASFQGQDKATFYAVDVDTVLMTDPLAELNKRRSLGWTDWAKVRELLNREPTTASSVILYIGDQRDVARSEKLPGVKTINVLGDFDPAEAAQNLLRNLWSPGWTDVELRFPGLEVAGMYPDFIPNIPLGEQGVVLGRYRVNIELSSTPAAVVKYIDGGTEKTESVKLPLTLHPAPDATEDDTSFIPRLWARRHLDHLLDQKSGPEVRDEIIALSESYHFITPYTSLLVLESDADRERFAVKRRLNMRDGERFFADSREKAHQQTVRNETKQWTAEWNRMCSQATQELQECVASPVFFPPNDFDATLWSQLLAVRQAQYFADETNRDRNRDGKIGSEYLDEQVIYNGDEEYQTDRRNAPLSEMEDSESVGNEMEIFKNKDETPPPSSSTFCDTLGASFFLQEKGEYLNDRALESVLLRSDSRLRRPWWHQPKSGDAIVQSLFPYLAPLQPLTIASKKEYSDEVTAVLNSLKREIPRTGGIIVTETNEIIEPRYPRTVESAETMTFYARDRRLTSTRSTRSGHTVTWYTPTEAGVADLNLHLGRTRKVDSKKEPPLSTELDIFPLGILENAGFTVQIEQPEPNRLTLTVKNESGDFQRRFFIDTKRHVLLRMEFVDGKNQSRDKEWTVVYDDFVEVEGTFYPRKVEHINVGGDVTRRMTYRYEVMDADKISKLAHGLQETYSSGCVILPEPLFGHKKDAENLDADVQELLEIIRLANADRWEQVTERMDKFYEANTGSRKMVQITWIWLAFMARACDQQRFERLLLDLADEFGKAEDDLLFVGARQIADKLLSFESGKTTRLKMLELLRPVYEKQLHPAESMRFWKREYANALNSAGRGDESLQLRREIADENKFDLDAQIDYAQHLGTDEKTIRCLESIRTGETTWTDSEQSILRYHVVQTLDKKSRHKEILDYTNSWITEWKGIGHYNPCDWYLTTLCYVASPEEIDECVKRWIAEYIDELSRAKKPEDITPRAQMKAWSVCNLITRGLYTGGGRQVESLSVDPKTRRIVVDLYRAILTSPLEVSLPNSAFFDNLVGTYDPQGKLARLALTRLADDAETMTPLRIEMFRGMTRNVAENDSDTKMWAKIAGTVEKRHGTETAAKRELFESIYEKIPNADFVAFLRRAVERAKNDKEQRRLNGKLCHAILGTQPQIPFSDTEIKELLTLLKIFADAPNDFSQRINQFGNVFVQKRIAAWCLAAEDELVKATRRELAVKEREFLEAAKKELAGWLAAETWPSDAEPIVMLKINALHIATGAALQQTEVVPRLLYENPDVVIRDAALTQLMFLAVQKNASTEFVKYVTEILEADADDAERKEIGQSLLITLWTARGDAETLLKRLAEWSNEPDGEIFGVELAKQHALQGNFAESIAIYEKLRAADLLEPNDYRRLAILYLATDGEEKYRNAMLDSYKTMDANTLYQRLWNEMEPFRQYSYRRGSWRDDDDKRPMPPAMNPDVPRMFQVLMRKSEYRYDFVYHSDSAYFMWEFYRVTKDFRILAACADALPGCRKESIYRVLDGFAQRRHEVFEEASVDEMLRRTAAIRNAGRSDVGPLTALDRRTLALLDLCMSVRGATVLNAPKAHVDRAEKALKSAFEIGNWQPGEKILYANFLTNLGKFGDDKAANETLNKERLRQLETFWNETQPNKPGQTADRAAFGLALAKTLCVDETSDRAIDLLFVLYKENLQVQEPKDDNGWSGWKGDDAVDTSRPILSWLVQSLCAKNRYKEAETLLLKRLEKSPDPSDEYCLYEGVYLGAIRNGEAETSLGSGQELYDAVSILLIDKLLAIESGDGWGYANVLCQINGCDKNRYTDAKVKEYARRVALEKRDAIMDGVHRLGEQFGILNPKDMFDTETVLRYYIEYFESMPKQRWRLQNRNVWKMHGVQMITHWRTAKNDNVPGLDDLEERLLKLLQELLRISLFTKSHYIFDNSTSTIFAPHHYYYASHYWKEKENVFLETLEEVYKEYADCGEVVERVTEYLNDCFSSQEGQQEKNHRRMLDILRKADADGVLDNDRRRYFVYHLFNAKQVEEALRICERLAKTSPHREAVNRIRALGCLERLDEARKLLAEVEPLFGTRFETAQALAGPCHGAKLYKEAISFYRLQLLSLGGSPNSLSLRARILSNLAECYSLTDHLAEAVDAACRAIVFEHRQDNRLHAINRLENIFRNAKPDIFAAYLADFEKEVETSGYDNPLIRRALAKCYESKNEFESAESQYKILLDLQPNDDTILEALFGLAERRLDPTASVYWTQRRILLQPRHVEHYMSLGSLFEKMNDPAEAERAYTSMVEMLPGESEGHEALAKLREQQQRLDDAMSQWHKVAEIRSLEPTGLLNVLRLQIERRQPEAARTTLKKLQDTDWPSRFTYLKQELENYKRSIDSI